MAFEDDVPEADSPPDPDAIVAVDVPAPASTGDEPGPIANGALAAAYDEARLRILQSLEQGTIDVVEAALVNPELVERVLVLVDRAEYKRRQAAPGVKLRPRAFGRDWRTPITNRWRG